MGNIRISIIKRLARELLDKYPEEVGRNFKENKELARKVLDFYPQKIQNQVAGYLTHLKRIEGGAKGATSEGSL